MPTTFPPTRVVESPGSPNNTFWSEDFGAYVDAYTSGTWPLNLAVDVSPMFEFLSEVETPLTGTNTVNGGYVMPSRPATQTEVYWGTEDIIIPFSALKVAVATNSQTNLEVDDSARFRVGDVLAVSTEKMLITAIVDADTLTVTRAQLGTTALASIAIDTPVYAIGRIAPEGSDPLDMDARDVDLFSNYTQIIGPYRIAFTGTAQAIQYGPIHSDEISHQMAARVKEINLRREFTHYHGTKYKSGRNRSMAGIRHYIAGAGTVDASSTALDLTSVPAALGAVWGRGGMVGDLVLMANPAGYATLNAINATAIRTTYFDNRRGLTPAQFVDTEYGSVLLLRNRWMPGKEAVIFRTGQAVRRPLRPLQVTPLPSSGDYSAWMMVGEETLEFKSPQLSAIFTNLSYTSLVPTSG